MQKKLEQFSKFQKYLDKTLEVAEEVRMNFYLLILYTPVKDMKLLYSAPAK